MAIPTDEQLALLLPPTLHTRWASELRLDPSPEPSCMCAKCREIRHQSWEAKQ